MIESNICIRFEWLLSIRCIAKIFLDGIGYSHLFWCTAFDAAHSDSLYPIWPISATYLHNKYPNMFCPKTKTTVDLKSLTNFVDFKWLQNIIEYIEYYIRSQFWITNVSSLILAHVLDHICVCEHICDCKCDKCDWG